MEIWFKKILITNPHFSGQAYILFHLWVSLFCWNVVCWFGKINSDFYIFFILFGPNWELLFTLCSLFGIYTLVWWITSSQFPPSNAQYLSLQLYLTLPYSAIILSTPFSNHFTPLDNGKCSGRKPPPPGGL